MFAIWYISKGFIIGIHVVGFFWFLCESNDAKQRDKLHLQLQGNVFLLEGLDYVEDGSTTILRIIGNCTCKHRVTSWKE